MNPVKGRLFPDNALIGWLTSGSLLAFVVLMTLPSGIMSRLHGACQPLSRTMCWLEHLQGEGRTIRFILAGDLDPGDPAAVAESKIRGFSGAGVIEWIGHVDEMPALMQSVDIVALPSFRESLPKGLIAATACALPLVTTDVPGCPEVLDDGINGVLVPVRGATALADAIVILQDGPKLARRLGLATREKALSRFDERIVVSRTLAVYRELMGDD